MPTKQLPQQPSLAHEKGQATDLLKAQADHSPAAAQRLREFHPKLSALSDEEIFATPLKRADAYLAIAREYGFPSWPGLKAVVEGKTSRLLQRPLLAQIDDPVFRSAVEIIDAGDVEALRKTLRHHPGLAIQRVQFQGVNYFRNPCLLDFVAENPVRNGTLPPNICEIAQTIIQAANPFPKDQLDSAAGLVASGRVPRECSVQRPLLEMLCRFGANPSRALLSALAEGEFEAAATLLNLGAPMTLAAAAALGGVDSFDQLLERANKEERHPALGLAAHFGNVRELGHILVSGEDTNPYNPLGFHSHSTPLHQAAYGGHLEAVKRLIRHGADPTLKDTLWDGTASDWAKHGGKLDVAEYLDSLNAGAK
jgi:hypothetical protein